MKGALEAQLRGLERGGDAATRQPIGLRLRVLMRRTWLDRQLAEGRNPETDPALGLRARELTGRRTRDTLARALFGVVGRAEQPPRLSAAVPLNNGAIVEARAFLIQLANRLEDPAPVSPRGMAMAWRLITDGASSLHSAGINESQSSFPALENELRAILSALDVSYGY